jgi:hypothetical protein
MRKAGAELLILVLEESNVLVSLALSFPSNRSLTLIERENDTIFFKKNYFISHTLSQCHIF